MDTLISKARSGSLTEEIIEVARAEGVDPNILRSRIADGRVVIIRNLRRYGTVKLLGVGEGLRTKVNVNVGTSTTVVDIDMEVEKCRIAVKYGSDSIMDLSIGGNLSSIRRLLIKASEPLPFGTVPTYQAYLESVQKFKSLPTEDYFLKVVEEHLRDGVDFMTIHAGITKELAKRAVRSSRLEPIVSRGGAILAAWMLENDSENPYLRNWDYLLELFTEYDATISLGDALRPGSIIDALDDLQINELINNARLVESARSKGVQVMVEGPGHVPLNKIVADIRLMKSLTKGAPYYVLGPLVTDIAMGYDHIAAAIGAAVAAAEGADLICYLTPAEHLSLPNPEQVKEGLIAAKIAAHAGDIVKLGSKVLSKDVEVSTYRAKLMWDKVIEYAFDAEKARGIYTQFGVRGQSCNMCGSLCVFLILSKYFSR
jgi:phosphomethylpyrimidine synthase